MFENAPAFDQDLGWCVDDDVNLDEAFEDTQCASTSCGVLQAENSGDCTSTGNVMTDSNIYTARDAWLADATAAEATYGHISTWDTSGVTDMSQLFCGSSSTSSWAADCNTAAASFNEDIGGWDTSGVTTMYGMLYGASAFDQDIGAWDTSGVTTMAGMFERASAFNQDLSDWAVQSVIDMNEMFDAASAFNQDLGRCVDDDVNLYLSLIHI